MVVFLSGIVVGVLFFDTAQDPTSGSAAEGSVRHSLLDRITGRLQRSQPMAPGPLLRGAGQPDSAVTGPAALALASPSPAALAPPSLPVVQNPPPSPPSSAAARNPTPPPPASATSPATQASAPAPSVPNPPAPEAWMEFDGRSYIEMAGPLDGPDVTLGAWIFLDPQQPNDQMRVIAGNRLSGCESDPSHYGFGFYVNEWNTGNRQLRLEWSDPQRSGCQVLASDAQAIPVGEWTHVAFAFQSAGETADGVAVPARALLFINAKLVKSLEIHDRPPQKDNHFFLGSSADRQYNFVGRIANAFVLNNVATPRQLSVAMGTTAVANWKAMAVSAAARLLASFLLDSKSKTPVTELLGTTKIREVEGVRSLTGSGSESGSGYSGTVSVDYSQDNAKLEPIPVRPPRRAAGSQDYDFRQGGNQWVSRLLKLDSSRVTGGTDSKTALADGTFSDDISPEEMARSDALGRERANAVRAAMAHAWSGYRSKAWGADELKPRSGSRQDNWGGMGMTLLDSLDTLYVMGMLDEFKEAKEWVAKNLNFNTHHSVSVFETTIRALGGLLSAYDLSGEEVFLNKARDLGDRLLPAFNTPTGIPLNQLNLGSGHASNPGWTGASSVLAELGTLQLEFRSLSHATGDARYGRKAERVIEVMNQIKPAHGLYPIYINPNSGKPDNQHVTFGALGDSFYEYLVKVWVQGGKEEGMYRHMYDAAMDGMTEILLQRSSPSRLMYVSDWNGNRNVHKMDHLVCFVPAMLALGAYNARGTDGEKNAQRDLQNAKAVMYTCWQMYERTATGIAPEYVDFKSGSDLVVPARAPFYILRPEAAESLFVLHQLTGNPIYREWGWKMFQAIDKYCRVTYGFGAHPDVNDRSRTPDDRMESFFLAETLKYLYMLQSPDHPISLERFVFNTEAHPLRIFKPDPEAK